MTYDEFLARVTAAVPQAFLALYGDETMPRTNRIRFKAITRERRLDTSRPGHSEPYDIVRTYYYYPDEDLIRVHFYSDYGFGPVEPAENDIPVDEDWCDDL